MRSVPLTCAAEHIQKAWSARTVHKVRFQCTYPRSSDMNPGTYVWLVMHATFLFCPPWTVRRGILECQVSFGRENRCWESPMAKTSTSSKRIGTRSDAASPVPSPIAPRIHALQHSTSRPSPRALSMDCSPEDRNSLPREGTYDRLERIASLAENVAQIRTTKVRN